MDLLPLWECFETFWKHPAPAKMILGSMIYLQFHIVCDMSPDPWFTSKSGHKDHNDSSQFKFESQWQGRSNIYIYYIIYIIYFIYYIYYIYYILYYISKMVESCWIFNTLHMIFQGHVPYLCHHKISIFRMPKFFFTLKLRSHLDTSNRAPAASSLLDLSHWKLAVEILTNHGVYPLVMTNSSPWLSHGPLTNNSMKWFFRGKS
jgi:hypothetical protein